MIFFSTYVYSRHTKRVSVFPVGLMASQFVASPIVAENGTVIDWHTCWNGGRKFALDMAGFAVNVGFMQEVITYNVLYFLK